MPSQLLAVEPSCGGLLRPVLRVCRGRIRKTIRRRPLATRLGTSRRRSSLRELNVRSLAFGHAFANQDVKAPTPSFSSRPSFSEQPPPPSFHLEEFLVGLVTRHHDSSPSHPIYGDPTLGLVRLPFRSSRKNGQCWLNTARKIAGWVEAVMDPGLLEKDSCWVATQTAVQITAASGPHSNTVLRAVNAVRLLAFWVDPTDFNWDCLSSQAPADSPFSHRCNRGANRPGERGCINGCFHGQFETREENESRKACAQRGVWWTCPGHGPLQTRCIWMHPEGDPKRCRNPPGSLPPCTCAKRCFP